MIQRYEGNNFIEDDQQGFWSSFVKRIRPTKKASREIRQVADGLAIGRVQTIGTVESIRQLAHVEDGRIRAHHFVAAQDHRMATIAESQRLADVAQLHNTRLNLVNTALSEVEELTRRHNHEPELVQAYAEELHEQLKASLRGQAIHGK